MADPHIARRARIATASLVIALSLCVAPAARAGDEAASAARAFARAKDLFEKRDFVGAITEFQLAYRLQPHHAVQCSIARCYENLNKVVEAADYYRRCLREGAEATKIGERIRNSLKDAEARIVSIDVVSPGKGGTIYVDGLPAGVTPRRIRVNPGDHVIEVQRNGANPARTKLQVRGGEERTVTLAPEDLAALAPASVPATQPTPPPRTKLRAYWFWSALGLTVALAATTTYLGVRTLGQRDDYEASPTKDGYDSFVNSRMLTNVFVGLTAAAGVSSTLLIFFTDFKGERNEQLTAHIGWGGTF
jgi:hypothetical protein